ncbi:MAG: GNAT family N-acetyltransferase [Anaerolineae bacterium]|jgi:L-amino acid N-acyltransferase YncA|nr:GNAT family N-acetyltransferase [Anaerolineae bacterium]MDH7475709.1 GNAT family N-acetyltransferase [Anaerolineae bacterium]
MDVTIRRATAEDAQGIVDVFNSIIEEGGLTSMYPALTVEQERAFIESLGPRSAMFVAEAMDTIVGFQTIEPFAPWTRAMDHVAIMGTQVYKGFRRQGIGRQLAAASLTFAREQGYEKVVIYVRSWNTAARDFYRSLGFEPRGTLTRQVKIEGQYDDEVFMEMFLEAVPEREVKKPEAAAEKPVEKAVEEKKPAAEEALEVHVRRAKRKDIPTITAIIQRVKPGGARITSEEVQNRLFEKGYWIAISRKAGGIAGWQAENLVTCIEDFYVYPMSYYPQVGGPLLETIEREAHQLSCEVAIVFIDEGMPALVEDFFRAHGYERRTMDELHKIWREVVTELTGEGRFMMVKKLLERPIMRPL